MPNPDPGVELVPKVFQPSELDSVAMALETDLETRSKAGARHLLRVPAVRALATDGRLLEIAGAVLGSLPTPFRATLFDKSADTNWLVVWHQDTALPVCRRVELSG